MQQEVDFPTNSNTTDKYFLLEKDIFEGNSPFTVRVSNNPKKIRATVNYILGLLARGGSDLVSIKATGQAISKAVRVAEIVKRKVFDLHQVNSISNMEVQDVYIPEEEGLDEVIVKKKISILEISLRKNADDQTRSSAGYQPPIDRSKVQTQDARKGFRPRIMGGRAPSQNEAPVKQVRVRERRTEPPQNATFFERNDRGHFRGRGGARRPPPNFAENFEARHREEREYRNPKEVTDPRPPREYRDPREQREPYGERREYREPQRDHREPQRDHREPQRDHREPQRDHREPQRDHREPQRDHREPQRDHREPQRDHRELQRDHREPQRDHKEPYRGSYKEHRDPYNEQRDYREPKEHREPQRDPYREQKEYVNQKEHREPYRENWEQKEHRDPYREQREQKDPRDHRNAYREQRDPYREQRDPHREQVDQRGQRDPYREQREQREHKEHRDPHREQREQRDPREQRVYGEFRDQVEHRAPQNPYDHRENRGQQSQNPYSQPPDFGFTQRGGHHPRSTPADFGAKKPEERFEASRGRGRPNPPGFTVRGAPQRPPTNFRNRVNAETEYTRQQ